MKNQIKIGLLILLLSSSICIQSMPGHLIRAIVEKRMMPKDLCVTMGVIVAARLAWEKMKTKKLEPKKAKDALKKQNAETQGK